MTRLVGAVLVLVAAVTLATSFTAANILPTTHAGVSNQPLAPGQFPPTSTITFPATSAYGTAGWNVGCASAICGTARDSAGGTNLLAVNVSILGPSGHYWNGTNFNTATTEQKLGASGTANWSVPFPASSFAAAGAGDGVYTVKAYATDGSGNIQAPATTASFTVDTTPPTNSPSLALQSPAGSSFKTANTIFYRGSGGGSGGSFALRNAVSDTGSGPASSTTAALAGASSGWAHTPSTVGTPAGGPYNSNPFTWAEGTTSAPTETVTSADAAGNTAAGATLTFTNDSAAPTGGALTVNGVVASGGGTSSSSGTGTFTIGARTDFADGGSGLAASTLTRQSATLSSANGTAAGTCGAFGGATVLTGSPAQALAGPACYSFVLTGIDNVGNAASLSTVVMVDTTAPSPPVIGLSSALGNTFVSGTTVYLAAQAGKSGGFTAVASSTDADSGILKLNFPLPAGFSGGGGDDTTSPYSTTYTWSGAVAATGAQSVTATGSSGLTAAAAFTVTPDVTPPAGGALTVNGVSSSAAGTVSTNSTGSFTIGSRTDFTDGGSGLASSTLTRQSATLASSNGIAAGTCGAFGATTAITGTPGQTLTGPACYLFTLTGTDNVGNTAVSSTAVFVDTTPPSAPVITVSAATGNTFASGTTVYVNAQAGMSGGFTAGAASSDADSGLAKLTFPVVSGFSAGGGDQLSSPYSTVYAWSGAAGGTGAQAVTATGSTGLSATATFTITPDTAAPASGALSVNGVAGSGAGTSSWNATGSFAIGSRTDYTDAGSGLASSILTRQQAALTSTDGVAAGTCAGFGAPTTITGTTSQTLAGPACYRFTLTGTDNVGNSATVSTIVMVDTTAPTAPSTTLSAASGNTFVSGTTVYVAAQAGKAGGFTATATSADGDSGLLKLNFPALTGFSSGAGDDVSSPFSSTYAWTGAVSATGPQTVTATNNAGLATTGSFTVTPDTTAPAGGALTVNGGTATGAGSTSSSSTTGFTIGTRTDFTDVGSGLASSTLTVQSETLSGSTCGSAGSGGAYGAATIIVGTTQPSIASGFCYLYSLTGTDHVGNLATVTTTVAVSSLTVFAATDLGNNEAAPCGSLTSHACTGASVTTTSGRSELILVHLKGSNSTSTTVASISGPFTGASQVASIEYPTATGGDYLFAWKATGSGAGPTAVTVTFDTGTTAANPISVDVVQLAAGNNVLGCSSCTGSGTTAAGNQAATASLAVQSAADTEIAFVGAGKNNAFTLPSGFGTVAGTAIAAGGGFSTLAAATACGQAQTTATFGLAANNLPWGSLGIEIQALAPSCATFAAAGFGNNLTVTTAASFTPVAGATYLVFAAHTSSAGDSASISSSALTNIAPVTTNTLGDGISWQFAWVATGTATAGTATVTFAKPTTKTGENDGIIEVVQLTGVSSTTPYVGSGTLTASTTAGKQLIATLSGPSSASDAEVVFAYATGDLGASDTGWATSGFSTLAGSFAHSAPADTGFGTLVGFSPLAASSATYGASANWPAANGDRYGTIAIELSHS